MASPQTAVQYNGVLIRNCDTRTFRQEAVYDESGSDLMFFKFTIRVVGYVHGDTAIESVGMIPSDQGNPAAAHIALRNLLADPRHEFKMWTGATQIQSGSVVGDLLFECDAMSSDSASEVLTHKDVDNGPKPRIVEITKITGSSIYRVECEWDISKLECDDQGRATGNSSGVLSNRWSCTDEIDQNFYTTRTFTGVLRTVNGNVNPNVFRNFVVPTVQPGMRLDRMRFAVTPDALQLTYEIVHKEVAFSPPRPATSWHYSYTESTGEAKTAISEVNVQLAAPRDANKAKLIEIAVAIADARLQMGVRFEHMIEELRITDECGDDVNRVSVYGRVRRGKPPKEVAGLIAQNMGRPISTAELNAVSAGYDSNRSRGGYIGDTVDIRGPIPLVGAFSAYLQSSCQSNHALSQAGEFEEGQAAVRQAEVSISASVVDSMENSPAASESDYLNSEHRASIYTYWQMESTYRTDHLRVQLPIALQLGSGGAATSAVARVGPPVTQRIIRMHGTRVGQEPRMPPAPDSYTFNGGAAQLLRHSVKPTVPDRDSQGQQVFQVAAEYVYAITVPPDGTTPLPVGWNPWEASGQDQHTTGSSLFSGTFV